MIKCPYCAHKFDDTLCHVADDPVDRTYSFDFITTNDIGDATASRFRSASTGPEGRVPSAPMTAPAPAVGVGAFSGERHS